MIGRPGRSASPPGKAFGPSAPMVVSTVTSVGCLLLLRAFGVLRMSLVDYARIQYRRLSIKQALHRNDALGALHRAWGYIHANSICGDYYEFGVYNGASLYNSWLSFRHFRNAMQYGQNLPYERSDAVQTFLTDRPRFYAFDTFAGMPDNDEGEDTLKADTFQGSAPLVLRRCRLAGLSAPDLVLVKGLFADNRDQVGDRPAAIVHVDCDLYASAVDALSLIEKRLVQGSVVLCDDYNLFRADPRKGERRALREFQERTGIELEPWFAYGVASQAFLCHIPPQTP